MEVVKKQSVPTVDQKVRLFYLLVVLFIYTALLVYSIWPLGVTLLLKLNELVFLCKFALQIISVMF